MIEIDSPFAMVVMIVLIVSVGRVIRTKMETDARKKHAGEDDAVVGGMRDEIVSLRDRVRVLEKLIMDDDRKLAREIDGLRGREDRETRY